MNSQVFSQRPTRATGLTPMKQLGAMVFVTMLLLLSLLWGLEHLTARAEQLQQPGLPKFTIVKTTSQGSAARGTILTFTIDVHNVDTESVNIEGTDMLPAEMVSPSLVMYDNRIITPEVLTDSITFTVIGLAPGDGARLVYQARIKPDAECGKELVNWARLTFDGNTIGTPAETRVVVLCSDLGDAPASDNHFSTDMYTVSGVKANYPTVYDPPSGAPSGPLHRRADLMHLGEMVSFERQADIGADDDPTNNILPPLDVPDRDGFDDGLMNLSELNFAYCEPATLELLVYMDPTIVDELDRAFINVWFDGNRDGDWDDVNVCEGLDAPNVPEHIVIDFPVSASAGYQPVSVNTTVPVYDKPKAGAAWLRVTLSEQRSVKIGNVGSLKYGDGRGVFSTLINADTGENTAGFELGETEDYFWPSSPEPGLDITEIVEPSQANFGDELTFVVEVDNAHPFAQSVAILDPVPPGMACIPESFESSSPGLDEGYDASSNSIFWRGEIPAEQSVGLAFRVRVTRCDPQGFVVENHAWAFEHGYPPVEAKAPITVGECEPSPRRIKVEKSASLYAIPGGDVEFTLTARNFMSDTTPTLTVVDPLPFGLWVDPASLPPGVELSPPNTILWQTSLRFNSVTSITFAAHVYKWACREHQLVNQAYWQSDIGLEGYSNWVWIETICSDLGDAPDSTLNHHGITNTAYFSPSVAGRYPTVWEALFYPPGEPSGPLHFDATKAWLGDKVSYELQADIGLDADGPNNILDSGLDNADNDQLDDGWLNSRVPLLDCEEATLKVRVFKNHAAMRRMWLNVWFDGNRDGDWEDWKFCGNDQRMAFEWIVQNFVVDMSTWPVNDYRDIVVRTALVMNEHPDEEAWVRLTLSENPPPRHPTTDLADGRGPDCCARHYRWGETEDYLAPGISVGDPGQVSIDKTASVADATVGDVYTYSVYLAHDKGLGPVHVVMTDVLPAEVKLAGGPTVTELNPSASPLVAYFDSHVGPNGAVGWRGALSPDAAIRVDFPVRVIYCPNDVQVIRNKAVVSQLGATSVLSAVVETELKCEPLPEPDIELHKYVVTDLNEEATDWSAVSGKPIVYTLVLGGDNPVSHTVYISDPMQSGVIAFAADASSGKAHIIKGGRAVVWKGELGPAIKKVIIRIRARLRKVDCDIVVKNTAYWYTRFHHGESNTTQLTLACYDLGDAPDSTNHFTTDMTAYPSVTATFPTVYTGTTPLIPIGPLHLRPLPLHLGPRVSLEFEADYGMDTDGVNNIKPRLDKADLDKADDGLELDKLQFTHCESQRIPVLISIAPSVLPVTGQEVFAYLNVWLDSNRDGDWNDAFDCPTPTGGQAMLAPEHIVIDYPIGLATLGPGLHHIFVTTTGPVPWPAESTGPAWLRVTLSERQSNKTLPAGCATAPNCPYGDGRGYETPFTLGETEDYLLRGPDQPDLVVEKHGSIHPFFGLASQAGDESRVWSVNWSAHYKNIGGMAVTDVEVVDTLSSGQELVKVHSFPPVTPTISSTTVTFTVGTLVPGQAGHVFIRTSVPLTTAPGTVLTNTITITGHSDSDPSNNSQVVTVTVPLLPPVIAYPRPGTLCSGLFTITGRVQPPGALVEVLINSVSVTTVTADAQGRWLHPVNLPDGAYTIQARAIYGSLTSLLSPPVLVTVDSSMTWSPLSLRFVSEYGHVVIPKDADGNADEDSWSVFLRPGLTYTVTVFSCCDDPNTSVTLELPDGQVIHLEDSDGDGWYVGTFTVPEATSPMSGSIRLCVTCYNIRYCSDGEVLIDPEGVVFDVTVGQTSGLLDDAVVACYEGQTDLDSGVTLYSSWDAESYGGQVNPQTTAADGYFSFFTPAGFYQLDVFKENYQPYRSWDLVVVDDPVEFNVPLTPDATEEADAIISISEAGFDPPVLTVEPGTIIEWTNIGNDLHTTTSMTPTARIEGVSLLDLGNTDGWDSGLLGSGETYKRQLDTAGSYYYYDHENPAYTGLIVVEKEEYQIYLPLVLRNG